jgi:hypothetical protein
MSYSNYNHEHRRSINCEPSQITADSNLWTPTVDQKAMLGMIYETDQGDRYKYCKNNTTALAKALLVAAEANDSAQLAKIQTNAGASAGDTSFTVEVATGSGIVDDELIDGYILINDGGDAMGDLYIVKSNKYTTTDTFMRVEIADAGGLRNAILVTDDVTIIKNQCNGVIVKPQALTSPVLGATTTIIPASYYFWAKVKGVAAVLVDNGDTLVVGEPAGHPGTSGVDGTIGVVANDGTDPVYGTVIYISAADEAALINLQITGM